MGQFKTVKAVTPACVPAVGYPAFFAGWWWWWIIILFFVILLFAATPGFFPGGYRKVC